MRYLTTYLIFLVTFSAPWFLDLQALPTTENLNIRYEKGFTRIGVILDQTSRPGKEAKVAIEIAIEHFNNETDHPFVLYLQNSRGKPIHAAIAAKELVDEHNVKAILGAHTWEEASAIAEVISESDIETPVFLSLTGTTPMQATNQWPFFLQSVPTQSAQMNAVAAILHSWSISQVTLIYESSHLASGSAAIISYLSQALRQTGGTLTHILPLTFGSHSVSAELEILKRQQRKVFVIHTSLELAVSLFQTANKMEMNGDGYIWIAINAITDLFHSISSTEISSLKGMIGVKSYFPENKQDFLDFKKRFRQKFRHDYPEDDQDEPGIFAVQGYNTMRLLKQNSCENFDHVTPILETTVEIVHVIGKGYHSVYWTEGLGFSETVNDDTNGATAYSISMDDLKQVLFPMQPWYADRQHRNLAESSGNRMRVGVPGQSLFKQFVNVDFDNKKNRTVFNGFVIAVFDEMMRELKLPYEYFSFNGSYDELMRQIPAERFDAIAGDVTIMSSRHEYVDFTQPYTESGLEMIVPVKSRLSNQPWLFMKPFTAKMWWFIAAVTLYNGYIIWLIERTHCDYLRGSIIEQIGIIIWLAFATLFTLRGDRLHSNLSRMVVVVWLFVALIITQSYTASFASMLTAQRLEPTITSVEVLRNMNATVGYCNGSLVNHYLKDVLGFKSFKVKSYNSTHRYAEALNSGEISAIFLEVPAAKVFLAQYCKSFIRTGETFKVGGFGFAFPRRYSWLSEANKALMKISEHGKLKELEDAYLVSEKCVDDESSPNEDDSLSPHSFSILFVLTAGTSTAALVIYIITSFTKYKKSNPEHANLFEFIRDHMRRSSSVVVHADSPTHPSSDVSDP
ncbi:putative periplasmic binding protein-like I [Helianthus annuus]|nr:putative periplasmic binding protein-like I [Helianthus annuus]KAJ0697477.1 putative periplasmic binding protein-like I [Helianthus annuus]